MEYDPQNFEPGKMDTSTHEATFAGFMKATVLISALSAGVCIFLLLVAY